MPEWSFTKQNGLAKPMSRVEGLIYSLFKKKLAMCLGYSKLRYGD